MSAATRPRWRPSTTAMVYLALVVVLAGGSVLVASQGGNLLTRVNAVGMLTRTSLLGFIAIGQTLVILCRSLDLSVGYVAALASLIGATTMAGDPGRIVHGVVAVLAVSAAIGLLNGLIITVGRVNPFITTLGMGLILKGYMDTAYRGPAGDAPVAFQVFGYARIGIVPVSTAVMLGLAIAVALFLHRTRTGYAIYAVGGDEEVARFSGIRTRRITITAHTLCAMAAGIAGLLIAARFGTGNALIYNNGYELESIAAVVLGGTYLLGGRGGIAGTIGGVLILAALDTVFNVMGVNPFVKDVLRGTIIIGAVALYARRQLDRRASRVRFGGDDPPDRPADEPAAPPVPAGTRGSHPGASP